MKKSSFVNGLDLRQQHPGGSKRRFRSKSCSFDQTNIAHAAQSECARDRQANHAATDHDNVRCSFHCCTVTQPYLVRRLFLHSKCIVSH